MLKQITRIEAEKKLKEIWGFERFSYLQWETISRLLKGERVLLVAKTGFGKSLCYQFPAILFDGITIVFSPLIALMRDQVKSLQDRGISAALINSEQDKEENRQVIEDAKNDKIKILFIAPERQENSEWLEEVIKMKISMVVIDEAHTISVWGHDFRPSFRRIINLVKILPDNFPVLATTATATPRVQKDIAKQISGHITILRGDLLRKKFQLYVVKVKSEDEKMMWLAEHLNKIEGTGIIYTGTRANTEIYSRWLQYLGISATAYNAGLDAETRKEIEKGLMENKWKAIISTNALGMGIDKPDIRFIIHTQIPQSPIHYYQEIGRAGRDGKPAKLILFYNNSKDVNGIEEDSKLPRKFIESAKPSIEKYNRVIEAIKSEPLREIDIVRKTNLTQTEVRVIKADLLDQKIIEKIDTKKRIFGYVHGAQPLNTSLFEELKSHKLKELDAMLEYVNLKTSRMKFLCDYLGDTSSHMFTNCDNTNLKKLETKFKEETKNKLKNFKEDFFPILKLETKTSNLVNGVAASYYGFSNVGAIIHRCKYETEEDFPDFLIKLTLKAYRNFFKKEKFDLMLYVPPTESGDLVKNFAEKLSEYLKIPLSHDLVKQEKTKPQKIFQNSVLKKDNVKDKFTYKKPEEVEGKTILLVDDIFDSGATIKEIGKMLTKLGVKKIAPLVIAKTIAGDISNG